MKDFITVQNCINGYHAVYMTYDAVFGEYMPWQSGIGYYKTRDRAVREAHSWAEAEGVECKC